MRETLLKRLGVLLMVILVLMTGVVTGTVRADQTDSKLDGLFRQLRAASEPSAAQQAEASIWQIWVHNGDPEVDRRMAIGILSINHGQLNRSLASFDKIVDMAPNFAEGWNKRATVHYLMGNYDASVNDIQKTLALEPRHFGALSGMGLIFDAVGNGAAAVRVWERALEVHPHMQGIVPRLKELKRELTGKPT